MIKQQPTNCLSVFDHFVGLAPKRFNKESLADLVQGEITPKPTEKHTKILSPETT